MKNVLITGASRGIGKALAYEFAKKGFTQTLLARDENNLKQIADELDSKGKQVFFKKCDVSDLSQMKESVDFAIEKMGSIDIAILNAGVAGSGYFDNFTTENLRRIFDVNVFGIANGLEVLIPYMKKSGSGIIAGVSSLADTRGVPGNAGYCASKTAASFLLSAARVELKSSGVKIVTIRPGFVKTDMTAINKFYMPFLMEVEESAKIIIKGLLEGKERIAFPLPMILFSYLGRALPSVIFEKLIHLWRKPTVE
jgi:short-subunit dehydrogenase